MQTIVFEDTDPAIQYSPAPTVIDASVKFPFPVGWSRRFTAQSDGFNGFSNGTTTTATGADAGASLRFQGSQIELYWTQGFTSCAGISIKLDGTSSAVPCQANGIIRYNGVAWTSPQLDPAVTHEIHVSIDSSTTVDPDRAPGADERACSTDKGAGCFDLDRFVVHAPTSSTSSSRSTELPFPSFQTSSSSSASAPSHPVDSVSTATFPQSAASPSSLSLSQPSVLSTVSNRPFGARSASSPSAPASISLAGVARPPDSTRKTLQVGFIVGSILIAVMIFSVVIYCLCRRRHARRSARSETSLDWPLGDADPKPARPPAPIVYGGDTKQGYLFDPDSTVASQHDAWTADLTTERATSSWPTTVPDWARPGPLARTETLADDRHHSIQVDTLVNGSAGVWDDDDDRAPSNATSWGDERTGRTAPPVSVSFSRTTWDLSERMSRVLWGPRDRDRD